MRPGAIADMRKLKQLAVRERAIPVRHTRDYPKLPRRLEASFWFPCSRSAHPAGAILTPEPARRVLAPGVSAAVQEKVPDTVEMLIFSKLDMLAGEIKDMKEEMRAAAKEAEKPKAKKKAHRKSSATEKKPPKKTQPQGEIK